MKIETLSVFKMLFCRQVRKCTTFPMCFVRKKLHFQEVCGISLTALNFSFFGDVQAVHWTCKVSNFSKNHDFLVLVVQNSQLFDMLCTLCNMLLLCHMLSNMPTEDYVPENKKKQDWQNLLFIYFLNMQLFLTKHFGKVLHSLTFLQKKKKLKINIFSSSLGTKEKKVLSSHSTYRRFLPWYNARASKVGIQQFLLTTDTLHTYMVPPFSLFLGVLRCFFLTYLMI